MKLYRNLNIIRIILEVSIIVIVFLLIGLYIKRHDPFLLGYLYSPTVILSIVLSLYYGFSGGLLFIATIAMISLFLYTPFPYEQMLWNLLIILIGSEFRYYWLQRVKASETESEYLKQQISRLRKELFLIKLSHEQLEFNYIVRPYSLRQMILELKKIY